MAKFFRGFSLLLGVLSLIFALAEAEKPCDTPFCNQVALEIEQAINKSVDPCTDFYEFTCGGWKANHQIPDDRSRYGQFDELNKKMQKQIETALKTDQKPKANSTDYARKLYDTCYAYDSKPSLGRTEVQDFAQNYMNKVIGLENIINHIQVPWYSVLVQSILFGDVSGFFDIGIQPDPKNVTKNIITMDSVGFTLGDNELKNLTANAHIVDAYRQLLEKIQMFFGQKNDTKLQSEANNIINLESELAKVMMSTEERRNPEALYNKMTLKQFSEKTGFDWFAKIVEPLVAGSHVDYKLSNSTEIIIGDVNYFVKAIKILENLNMETYYDYFGMKSVLKFGMFASNEIRQYLFEFNQVRMGVKKQAELWQICLALASDQLSVALSRLFVDTQFNEMQKKSDLRLRHFIYFNLSS